MAKRKLSQKRRQKIQSSNKAMFAWVAVASVLLSFTGVAGYYVYKQIVFEAKVLTAVQKTNKNLKESQDNIGELRNNISALEANEALARLKTGDKKALQVIIDALPADGNSLAVGSALEQNILPVSNVEVESFSVSPTASETQTGATSAGQEQGASASEAGNSGAGGDTSGSADGVDLSLQQISFSFSVTSKNNDAGALRELLKKMEKSIRTISIDSIALEKGGDQFTMNVEAHVYYMPEKTIQLNKERIKP